MHFAGKRAPTGDPLRFGAPAGRATSGVSKDTSSSGKHGSSSADCGEGGGCTVTGWLAGWLRRWRGEPFRLPSHLCRSALARECAGSVNASGPGENAFREQAHSHRGDVCCATARRLDVEGSPTRDQLRFRAPAGSGHDPGQALLRWLSIVANGPGRDGSVRITPDLVYHEPTFILRAASLVPVEARCDERFATHRHPARV
jgi:hypothetical protein